MDRLALLRAYDEDMRRDAWVPGLPAQRMPELTRYYDAGQREVLVMWHAFGADQAERIVERELAFFGQAGAINWKIYDGDEPANLAQVLRARGFVPEEESALMTCPTESLASLPLAGPADVLRLTTAGDVDQLDRVWSAVWPDANGGWVDVIREVVAEGDERLQVMVARIAGEPVASGYVVLDPRGRFAYLGGGATVEAHRGRGLYRSLVLARARIAKAAGIAHLAVEASAQSRPVLERLGFIRLTTLVFHERRGTPA